MAHSFEVAVIPGDGIGLEITPAALDVADAALARTGAAPLARVPLHVGAQAYLDTGTDLSEEATEACAKADAIFLGACGLPSIRKDDGTEIRPQVDLRFLFDLYAGVRPTRLLPGVPTPLASPRASEIDFVLIRESTEGLFSPDGPGTIDDERATDMQVITRETTEKVSKFAFAEAARRMSDKRKPKVTLIDKANVFVSFVFMRKVFDEIAETHAGNAEVERIYVDASTLSFLNKPWDFDVILTENMFGDILSDLAAGLVGGMGYAPSADIGDERAVFQPAHGSAPDIMGTGKANPTAAILSAGMMLDWLGRTRDRQDFIDAHDLIQKATDDAFRDGLRTAEYGGSDGVKSVTEAVLAKLS